jgi:hypothetical protein
MHCCPPQATLLNHIFPAQYAAACICVQRTCLLRWGGVLSLHVAVVVRYMTHCSSELPTKGQSELAAVVYSYPGKQGHMLLTLVSAALNLPGLPPAFHRQAHLAGQPVCLSATGASV